MYHHHPYTVDYGVGSVAPPQFSYDWNYNNYAMSAPNYAGMPLYSSYPGGGRGGVGNQCKYNKGENNYIFFPFTCNNFKETTHTLLDKKGRNFSKVTEILSKKTCIFRLVYWRKVTKFVKMTKILSEIVLSGKIQCNSAGEISFVSWGWVFQVR